METVILNYTLDDAKTSSEPIRNIIRAAPLSTKKAVEYFVNGTLRSKVCKYCLNVSSQLSELDQIYKVAGPGVVYDISIRDMITTVYPFQITDDPNLPSMICNRCLNKSLSAYLFAQRCEQTDRAIRNCFTEIDEKLSKLDPIEDKNVKKRGRKKTFINHNVLHTSHENVIDYAEPLIHLINRGSAFLNKKVDPQHAELECPKCWQVLPNIESLVNHEKSHPSSMWFHCRLCGSSFAKLLHLKRHIKTCNSEVMDITEKHKRFSCKDCGAENETYILHLQHVEKHKFKKVLDHLVMKRLDDLCTVCLDKGSNMEKLQNTVALHGNCPELNGDKSLYNIVGATLPLIANNFTGTNICQKCLEDAVHSYVFINRSLNNRRRFNICVTAMLNALQNVNDTENSVFVEISENLILPAHDLENNTNNYLDDDIDEAELKVDILEDEFREELSSESEDEKIDNKTQLKPIEHTKVMHENSTSDTVSKLSSINTEKYNGYCKVPPNKYIDDVCKEFLTFRKRSKTKDKLKIKFTCPYCSKRFINVYYLDKHMVKHYNRTIKCRTCLKEFKNKFSLHEHNLAVHVLKNDNHISCDICGRTYIDLNKFNNHKKTHFSIHCHLCNRLFRTQSFFDAHLKRHALKIKIQKRNAIQNCSFCEKEFLSDNELSVHVNKVHLQMRPYNCNMCEKQFYTRKNMIDHKLIHSVYCKEKCEFCDKILKCRRDLVRHLNKHIG